MATVLRCLIVEDDPDWREYLHGALGLIGGGVEVQLASNPRIARRILREREPFDLATIDLSLLNPSEDGTVDDSGLRIVEDFFRNSRSTALLVVTGNSTAGNTRKLLLDRTYRVFDVVEKKDFKKRAFLRLAREALLSARLRQAEERAAEQFRLKVALGRESWLGSELRGPDLANSYRAEHPVRFAAEDLARRGDQIDFLLRVGGPEAWRREADSVGQAVLHALQGDRRIAADFTRAKTVSTPQNPLWIEFGSPPTRLGIPFELIWDEGDRLCFKHLVTHHLAQEEGPPTRKTDSFRRFIEKLAQNRKPLRMLLVGSDDDGELPKVKEEIEILAADIEIEALRLGLEPRIVRLWGSEANEKTVRRALEQGEFHLFHYAGHGYYQKDLPEAGGLVLGKTEILKASDLRLLMDRTPLHFVFLNCCLSARTAQQEGHGDFQGVLDALAQADVPAVLGYRWTVRDEDALELAQSFYRSLWRTLSPAHALYEARRSISMGPRGRDDETWASPILLCQTD